MDIEAQDVPRGEVPRRSCSDGEREGKTEMERGRAPIGELEEIAGRIPKKDPNPISSWGPRTDEPTH